MAERSPEFQPSRAMRAHGTLRAIIHRMTPPTPPAVEHRLDEHRFVVHLPEGEGELTYALPEPGVIDLQHTGTDESLRGRGVGEALVRAALDYARRSHLRVVPSCRFVRHWLARHPEEQDVLARP